MTYNSRCIPQNKYYVEQMGLRNEVDVIVKLYKVNFHKIMCMNMMALSPQVGVFAYKHGLLNGNLHLLIIE